jgi:ABC-type polysaccharide/polyol phosphate export permease
MFKELLKHRELLLMLTLRDIKIKYKQSIMGFMWAIFIPSLTVAAGIMIKMAFSFISGKPLELGTITSVAVKSLPWAFFISSIRFSTTSLTSNSNLVTKIYFPREVLPIAAVLSNLFDFAIASITLTVVFVFARIGVSMYLLWLPLLLVSLIVLTIALGMILSCGNLFFRDVKYIVEVIMMFSIFFTPVFYDASIFGKWSTLLLLNPIAPILENINAVVILHQPPNLFWFTYSFIWAVGSLFIFWRIFHKAEFIFAENI